MTQNAKERRKEQRGWYWYDWAASAFSTTVVTVFLGPYLTNIAQTAESAGQKITILGLVPITAASYFPYIVSLSVALQILVMPVVGALVDVVRSRRLVMAIAAYIGAVAVMGMWFLEGSAYQLGGVLFIDEAYYLYRPENERDYGQEAIEILLQVMENQRDDLVVILAGYKDRMDTFFSSNPGMSSRIAHHLDFPDYSVPELLQIAEQMLVELHYRFEPGDGAALEDARSAFEAYLHLRMRQPHFANARSVRNALDRARLRQASRLFREADKAHSAEDLSTLSAVDIRASRVFAAAVSV